MKVAVRRYFTIPKNREISYDYIRVLSCFLVILAHASGSAQGYPGEFIRTLVLTAMPIFFFLSGALVLNDPRTENVGSFYWRRFVGVVVPFLMYGIIYTGWIDQGNLIPGLVTTEKILTVIHLVPTALVKNLAAPQAGHLWFVYSLTGLYLVSPFLRRGLIHLGGGAPEMLDLPDIYALCD